MTFNSLHFLAFFPIVTLGYFLLNYRHRWWWLLAASCYFYMVFKPEYILILLLTIIIDYYAGLVIEKSEGPRRKQWLIVSLIANIGVLAVFKYYNFFVHFMPSWIFSVDTRAMGIPYLDIIFPIGLSFHTFQAMSYTIEVYRGHQQAERHFGIYALYVMFYPQLVAGPIERPQNILHQFRKNYQFDYERIVSGFYLMTWGMFKKVVIADRLTLFVDPVYNNPLEQNGLSIAIATFFFAFQIFCDFSGYSDIAIGAARVMGFDLMKNFNMPYHATSIGDFWRRWHISLSTWFRDYVYIPLGGSRVSQVLNYRNYFIVFFLSGLWHGANWNYIIWGVLHAIYLIIGLATKKLRASAAQATGLARLPRLHNLADVVITFILVDFAWLFFRANYIAPDIIWSLLKRIPKGWDNLWINLYDKQFLNQYVLMGNELRDFALAFLLIVFLETFHHIQKRYNITSTVRNWQTPVRWAFYTVILFVFLFLGIFESDAQFIYFQF